MIAISEGWADGFERRNIRTPQSGASTLSYDHHYGAGKDSSASSGSAKHFQWNPLRAMRPVARSPSGGESCNHGPNPLVQIVLFALVERQLSIRRACAVGWSEMWTDQVNHSDLRLCC